MKRFKIINIIKTIISKISTSTSRIGANNTNNSNNTNKKEINIFVSPLGNDSNNGSEEFPFQTLEATKNKVTSLINNKEITKGKININIMGGTYYMLDSFILNESNSPTESIEIFYKAYRNENVTFTGSANLNINDFQKLSDEEISENFLDKETAKNILKYDLKTNNIYYGDPNDELTNIPELFFNDEPMIISRYPNEGYLYTGQVINNETNNFSFIFEDSKIKSWKNTDNIWMFGYWYHNWKDDFIKVDSIDFSTNEIHGSKNASYGIKENQRFYFVNVLDELDEPNEYYIDKKEGILYFYPPNTKENSKIQLSQNKNPLILINNAKNITISNITFESSIATAIVLNNTNNILIDSCTFRNLSKNAVNINNGLNTGVSNSKIYNIGSGGISVSGGDRNTLIPSNNFITNTEFFNFSRIKRCYSPAININGVGVKISNNLIYNAPHCSILFYGNNHIIEYNEIHSVAKETDDVGAIYTGRDWTYRGNIIRYNYLHDIGNSLSNYGMGGIYLDDCMSSAEVYKNIFYKVDKALFIGGGRDHKIYNNIILDCKKSIEFDARGLTWNLDQLYNNLNKVDYTNEYWKKQYPELANIEDISTLGVPTGNVIINNILYKTANPNIAKSVIDNGTVYSNEFIDDSIQLSDLKKEIESNSKFSYFQPIEFDKIGLNRKKS